MKNRVLRGDVRRGPAGDVIVLYTERGRSGEARTMVTIGAHVEPGVAQARETRALATVDAWPRVGRMRVSLRPAGGYYVAPWLGKTASLLIERAGSAL